VPPLFVAIDPFAFEADAGIMAAMSDTLTIHLDDKTATALDALASKLHRSKDAVAAAAIAQYVSLEASHIADIEAGIAEADAGLFAEPSEVDAITA
jgi:predicted transcriptional regulator